ncbi:hypothetical protein PR048_010762 [Dryococelus australis]|uniref:Uncharacterized protein n=1 Tax=Dryococelus australis TaxID=614101 RepID=A0ABQ9I428_9NEOP|nr:hypothetical protein PR048_010762 [Dryococelus australis]
MDISVSCTSLASDTTTVQCSYSCCGDRFITTLSLAQAYWQNTMRINLVSKQISVLHWRRVGQYWTMYITGSVSGVARANRNTEINRTDSRVVVNTCFTHTGRNIQVVPKFSLHNVRACSGDQNCNVLHRNLGALFFIRVHLQHVLVHTITNTWMSKIRRSHNPRQQVFLRFLKGSRKSSPSRDPTGSSLAESSLTNSLLQTRERSTYDVAALTSHGGRIQKGRRETVCVMWVITNINIMIDILVKWFLKMYVIPGEVRQPLSVPPPPGFAPGGMNPLPFVPLWGRGGVLVRLLASHQDEPGSSPGGATPGFSYVITAPNDVAGRRAFSGISRFPRPCIPPLLRTRVASPSPALKTSMLSRQHLSTYSYRLFTNVICPFYSSTRSVYVCMCRGHVAGEGYLWSALYSTRNPWPVFGASSLISSGPNGLCVNQTLQNLVEDPLISHYPRSHTEWVCVRRVRRTGEVRWVRRRCGMQTGDDWESTEKTRAPGPVIEPGTQKCRGARAVSTLASHQGEPGSILGRVTGFGNRARRCRWSASFLGALQFSPHFQPGAAPYSPQPPASALKTSLLRATQISSLTH